MMLALLLHAYCEGERSSRRIERRCREDIAFRVLSANQQPDHATICRFRQRHEQALAGLFVEAPRLCAEAGLAPSGLVALDGTKLRANASRERNRTAAQLEAEVGRMLAEAEQADAYETRLREREQKDVRGRQPKRPESDPDTKVNLSDPDSRIVRDYWGHYQGDNVQAVATREQVTVAAELTRATTDVQELQPMVETTNHNLEALGQAPVGTLLADAGYYSDANVRSLAEAGPELLIASRNDHNRRAAGPAPRGRIPDKLSTRELVRQALKDRFPTVKVSVRSSRYAGGASVHLKWSGGPLESEVEVLVEQYEGSRLDGDYSPRPVIHFLHPDGRVLLAHNPPSSAIGACDPEGEDNRGLARLIPPDVEQVRFGAQFVRCHREPSDAEIAEMQQQHEKRRTSRSSHDLPFA